VLSNYQLAERRRNSIRRRSQLSHNLTPWLCLLVAGILVMVFAMVTLLSTSAAKSDAAVTEGKYFSSTVASAPGAPAVEPASSNSVIVRRDSKSSPATGIGRTTGSQSTRPSASSASAGIAKRSSDRLAIPRQPASQTRSVPLSIELGGSRTPIRVVPIGISAAGTLEPPSDISTAGWWVSGPRPGAPGRAIITGHIDSTAGLGAFAALDRLHNGDTVALNEAAGEVLHFRVTARQQIEKTHLNPRLLQSTTNASDLLLVTCTGTFDHSTRSYESNLLITAVPVRQ